MSDLLDPAANGVTIYATADEAAAIVDVRGLKKRYSGSLWGRKQVNALRGVSLSAAAGEVFGLLGPNGAGKTTLIKILLGVVRPSDGAASLFGEPVGSTAARRRVGYLPESLRVDRHHTARSALKYYGRLSGMSPNDITRRSDELLDLVGLKGRDKESVKRFSKGMYQRLGLAQALMHNPDLLVLDEPTDGLDPVGRNEVRRVIERLRDDGKTIFLNSHILQEVEMICTRVAILSKGEICGSGNIDEMSSGATTNRVTIEVAAPETAFNGQRAENKFMEWIRLSDSSELDITVLAGQSRSHRLDVTLDSQEKIDGAVDRLRQAGVSIARLEPQRETLEDTFMKLVSASEESA